MTWQRATRISLCWLLLSSGWLSYQCTPITSPTEKLEQSAEPPGETTSTPELPQGDATRDATIPDASERTSESSEAPLEGPSEPAPPESGPPEPTQPQTTQQLEQFFQQHGGRSAFTAQYVDALTTFLTVEDLYFAGKYNEGKQKLDALFKQYPHSDPRWNQAKSNAHGTNVGNPVAYYGLRMLQEMINFRLATPSLPGSATLTLTVLLVDCLKGVQPTTMKELQDGTGKEVQLSLTPAVKENGHAVIKQSLRLFREYIFAITKGKLKVDIAFQDVNICARGVVRTEPFRTAGLAQSSEVYAHIPDAVKRKTSWWWVLYPSLVPAQYPDFKTTEFITGGMGVSLRGAPEFISDD